MRRAVTYIAGVLLGALTLCGADFTGIWMGRIPARNGSTEVAFKFVQSGTALRGKLYGDYGSMPVIEGKVTGDEVSFVVLFRDQAGNEIAETRYRFAGSLKDGLLEMNRERESSRNVANGQDVQFRQGTGKTAFKLKRLL